MITLTDKTEEERVAEGHCRGCGETKRLDEFHKDSRASNGKASQCKACRSSAGKKYRMDNVEKLKAKGKNYYTNNREKLKSYARSWNENNKERHRECTKLWRLNNRGRRGAQNAGYRASKLNATPPWLTEEQLNEIKHKYLMREEITRLTGIQYHVDHIHPLKGKNICGLHVPWNLQIITAEENLRKYNSFSCRKPCGKGRGKDE